MGVHPSHNTIGQGVHPRGEYGGDEYGGGKYSG